jgi:hypothetical protein
MNQEPQPKVVFNVETLNKLLAVSERYTQGVPVNAEVVIRGSRGFKMLSADGILALPAPTMPQEMLIAGETLPCVFKEIGGTIRASLDVEAARAATSSK